LFINFVGLQKNAVFNSSIWEQLKLIIQSLCFARSDADSHENVSNNGSAGGREGRLESEPSAEVGVRVEAAGGDHRHQGDDDAAHGAAQSGAHADRSGGQEEVRAQAVHRLETPDGQLPGRGSAGERVAQRQPAVGGRLESRVAKVEATRADRQRPQGARDFRLNASAATV
jgi:hypothetical protein